MQWKLTITNNSGFLFFLPQSFFIDRCFQLFDRDCDGQIKTQEFVDELRALVFGTQTEKLRFLFNIYNIRGTGKLVKSEVQQMLKSCMEESKLKFSADNLQALTDALVTAANTSRDGRISFDELRALVEKHPTIAENLNISPSQTPEVSAPRSWCRHFSRTYVQNNMKKIVFLIVFFLINVGLGAVNGWRYWDQNNWIILARINGLPLNFNCTVIVLLMLRRLITALRATFWVKFLPIDQNIMFHKLCGYLILAQSIAHTIGHIGNAGAISTRTMTPAHVIFTTKAGYGWVANTAPPTGASVAHGWRVRPEICRSRVRAPPPAHWPDGGPESLRSPCCGLYTKRKPLFMENL
ncbi:NADPH oxidase 5-like [Plakobranchus ocellatus]|uniref:NADPH oxidase 5-like n=1 Tax=Plakobranchus ocellatus TaxID=259542 RepID=A0AAV4BNI1_9GAST|nr:NADPH oxidase 5-like [Plakobranchus ocellatus]